MEVNRGEGSEDSGAPVRNPPEGDGASPREIILVGIGASAGGLDPTMQLISQLPADTGMAFIAVHHLDPRQESHLAGLLATHTTMPVAAIADDMEVQPNHVYTNPPGSYVGVQGKRFFLAEAVTNQGRRMPIDFLFESMAKSHGPRTVGVILSGSGADGTQGIRAIRNAGGVAIVQDPDTAQYADMPRSGIATGLVDAILPVEEIGQYLVSGAAKAMGPRASAAPEAITDEAYDATLGLILARTRCDFRNYKRSTIVRRICRRMGLARIEKASHYVEYLRRNPSEVDEMRNDLLIGVTGFFREADAYQELLERAIRPLVDGRGGNNPLRIWVPGCATGEEAYSLAMLFTEEMEHSGRIWPLQIFASDIDPASLEAARDGVYRHEIEKDVSGDRLKRFFTEHTEGYMINKQLREQVVFSIQNLVTDPPFSKLDLVSCRNVLIYLLPEAQKKIASMFAFALNPGGFLFLGKSDSITGREDLFELISKKGRVYRRRTTARPDIGDLTSMRGGDRRPPPPAHTTDQGKPLSRLAALALANQQVLLEHFGAAVILADSNYKILHFFGDVGRYVQFPTGEADLDLLKLARDPLGSRLRPAVHKALRDKQPVLLERVVLTGDGAPAMVNVTVRRVEPDVWGEPLVAVVFGEILPPSAETAAPGTMGSGEAALALEAELKGVREELRSAYQEFESSNEQLRAANEEVMSINEELQSTNEELQTSKEEMQSMNEELTTVNDQLSRKLDELGNTNNDLANFTNTTQVATIFLDKDLRIRRFTPEATQVFHLIAEDAGRPIAHISHALQGGNVMTDARQVLDSLATIERDVRSESGAWYTMRLFPYRTLDNRIDGVVVTFLDVTRIKMAERLASRIVETVRHPVLVVDTDMREVLANQAFRELLGIPRGEALMDRHLGISGLRQLLARVISADEQIVNMPLEIDSPSAGKKRVILNASRIEREPGRPYLILLGFEEDL